MDAVRRVAEDEAAVAVSHEAEAAIAEAHACLLRHAGAGAAIYGVSTGLGAAVDTAVAPQGGDAQRRIVEARAVGVGPFATVREVRATMVVRLARLCLGRSGASTAAAAGLATMLNEGIHPRMPLIGSIGEADLAPLAHLAWAMTGDGPAETRDGRLCTGGEAFAERGLALPRFAPKDGLALVSSNAAAVGLACLAVGDAERVLSAALAATALSFEAFRASLDPIDPAAMALRPVPRGAAVAQALHGLLAGGDLPMPGAARRLQDPLSLRVGPHVLAACLDALDRARAATNDELASSDDNPAVLVEADRILPNGNFDATHLALSFDALALALARLAAAGGERIAKLMSPAASDLPRFLAPQDEPGANGFATLQKTVAALVAEIAHAAAPLPFTVLPVADRVEDYASMAMPGIRRLQGLVAHLRMLVAIEMVVAARACDLRGARLGEGTASLHAAIRERVPPLLRDRPAAPDIAALDRAIARGELQAFRDEASVCA
ncbi:aromatic amino acid lyase [Aureimonas flava]|uniref:aromatic amino acid lyase n=1 Tax=Aureimonas flava TaxID=2320271 RepID=UPI001AECF797|nr:aromatic amino acid lyase [Aureimonas flava]